MGAAEAVQWAYLQERYKGARENLLATVRMGRAAGEQADEWGQARGFHDPTSHTRRTFLLLAASPEGVFDELKVFVVFCSCCEQPI